MSLQAAIDAELPYLRAQAEGRMQSVGAIMRKTGNMTQDEGTGYEAPEWAVVDADCPGRLGGAKQGGSGSRVVSVGGVDVTLALREWHMPISRPRPADGDLIEVLSGENAGVVLRVVEGFGQDQATARRIPVVEIQRPEEWA